MKLRAPNPPPTPPPPDPMPTPPPSPLDACLATGHDHASLGLNTQAALGEAWESKDYVETPWQDSEDALASGPAPAAPSQTVDADRAAGPTATGQARRTSFNELGWFGKKVRRRGRQVHESQAGELALEHLQQPTVLAGKERQALIFGDQPAPAYLPDRRTDCCQRVIDASLLSNAALHQSPARKHRALHRRPAVPNIDCHEARYRNAASTCQEDKTLRLLTKRAMCCAALQVRNEMVQRVVEAQPGQSYTIDEVACCSVTHGEKFRPIMRFQCAALLLPATPVICTACGRRHIPQRRLPTELIIMQELISTPT